MSICRILRIASQHFSKSSFSSFRHIGRHSFRILSWLSVPFSNVKYIYICLYFSEHLTKSVGWNQESLHNKDSCDTRRQQQQLERWLKLLLLKALNKVNVTFFYCKQLDFFFFSPTGNTTKKKYQKKEKKKQQQPSFNLIRHVKPGGHPSTRIGRLWHQRPNRRVEHWAVFLLQWSVCL